MTRKAKITIHSIQLQDGQREEMRFAFEGRYVQKGSCHYAVYEEQAQDTGEIMKNRLKFSEQSLKVTKKGAFSSDMYFEEGKSYPARYTTPFGEVPLSMRTREYYVKEYTDGFELLIGYDMLAGHSYLVSCQMEIRIRLK